MKRFGICLAVAFFAILALPGGGLSHWYGGVDTFLAMARGMAIVLLLAIALYAATLFVEYVRTRHRPPD